MFARHLFLMKCCGFLKFQSNSRRERFAKHKPAPSFWLPLPQFIYSFKLPHQEKRGFLIHFLSSFSLQFVSIWRLNLFTSFKYDKYAERQAKTRKYKLVDLSSRVELSWQRGEKAGFRETSHGKFKSCQNTTNLLTSPLTTTLFVVYPATVHLITNCIVLFPIKEAHLLPLQS